MLALRPRELAFPDLHGSSLNASESALFYSALKRTNGVWLLGRPVNVIQSSRQLTSWPIYHHANRASSLSNVDKSLVTWLKKHVRPVPVHLPKRRKRRLVFRDKNQKIRDRLKIKTFFFREHYFLGIKIKKFETDLK